MKRGEWILRERLQTGFLGIIAFAVILFLLVQAKFILISLAVAIIIFSLTSDAIAAFARLSVPNWLATTLAFLVIGFGILWIAVTLVAQMNEIVSSAITYSEQVRNALPGLMEWLGPRAQEAFTTFAGNLNITGWLRSAAAQASNLVSGAVLIVTFVGFMFTEKAWFPIKLDHLTQDPQQAQQVRAIIASIISRVNRYLIVKAAVSLLTALLVWAVFRLGGLALATPVAMLTFVLNFIPTVGSITATVVAVALASVQLGELGPTLIVALAVGSIQLIIGNVLDPMLLGQTLRLSSFGIVLSLAFWGLVWGLPGMFLAVPITVASMIICTHVPWLRPVAILLSREGTPYDGPLEPVSKSVIPKRHDP